MIFAFFLLFVLILILLYKLIYAVGEIHFSGNGKKTEKIAKILDLVERDWLSSKNVYINKNMKLDPFYWYMKARKESFFFDSEYGFGDEYSYTFENDYVLRFYVGDDRSRIVLRDRTGSKISEIDVKKTNAACSELLDKIKSIRYVCQDLKDSIGRAQRKYNEYQYDQEYNRNQRAYSGFTQSGSQPKNDEYSGLDLNKADKLRKLDEKIKLRQEQINKMPKGSDRDGLVNELDNYKRARERMLKV
jgi:hypothetical protein